MIEYRKGSLFNAPKGSIILHACNCMGVWGSGVAAEFKRRFPHAYDYYKDQCAITPYHDTNIGTTLLIESLETDYTIACAFTSVGYGQQKDSKDKILKNTTNAIKSLLAQKPKDVTEIHLPKINAGLFAVPWEETAKIIEDNTDENIKWVVWELE